MTVDQKIPPGAKRYIPGGATLRRFLLDASSLMSCIQGPVGSGKSTAAAMKLHMRILQQAPQKDGVRRTRWVVIRNTFDELKRTTIATWKALFPEVNFGKFYDTPPFRHEMRFGDVEADVWFLAMDSEDDRKKLLSFEVTGAWINEAREVPREILSSLLERVGRYPAKMDGGASWSGVVMDTNAPAEDHYIAIMSDQTALPSNLTKEQKLALIKPDDWAFYIQPGGLIEITDSEGNHVRFEPNPEAENIDWLPGGHEYYMRAARGRPISEARVSLCNKVGRLKAGKPVWPGFRRNLHVAKQDLHPVPGHPIQVGQDFGLTPAALIGQNIMGRWLILDELVADDDAGMGAITFAPLLKAYLAERFPGFRYQITGDPAGDQKAQSDERTPFMVFRACGLPILPASTNDWTLRKEVVESALARLVNGYPAMLISPRCVRFIAAVEYGYRYAKLKVDGDRYSDAPVKDQHSHIAEAGQYMFLGGGEGRALLSGSPTPKKPTNTRRPTKVLKRGGGR